MHELFTDLSNAGELRHLSTGLSHEFLVASFSCEGGGELIAEFASTSPAHESFITEKHTRRFLRMMWRTTMHDETIEVKVENLRLSVRIVSPTGDIEEIGEPVYFYELADDVTERISALIQAAARGVGVALV